MGADAGNMKGEVEENGVVSSQAEKSTMIRTTKSSARSRCQAGMVASLDSGGEQPQGISWNLKCTTSFTYSKSRSSSTRCCVMLIKMANDIVGLNLLFFAR